MTAYLPGVSKSVKYKVRSECEWVVDHVVLYGAVFPNLPPPVRTAAQGYSVGQLIQSPLVFDSQCVWVHLMDIWKVSRGDVGPCVLVSRSKLPQHHICVVKTIHSSFHHLKHIPVEINL